MDVATLIGIGLALGLLVVVQAVRIPRSRYSDFELRRRQKMGDPQATFGLKRQAALEGISGLRQLVSGLLILVLAALLYVNTGVWAALGYGLLGLFVVNIIAKRGLTRRVAQKIYRRIELSVVELCLRHRKLLGFVAPPFDQAGSNSQIDSREELRHTLSEARHVVSSDEATLLTRALDFYGHTVAEIMTPRNDMMTVEASELLGPLVLSDLHKTGHTIFPVENTGEIVGMLDISDHAALRSKESVHVRDIMYSDVIRIDQDETLDEALKLLVAVKQPSLIVTYQDDVVGLVSLGDVVRALTGWKRR